MNLRTRSFAEFIRTTWLVIRGMRKRCLGGSFPQLGIGLLGVSLAFGLTVLTMAYAIGHCSSKSSRPNAFTKRIDEKTYCIVDSTSLTIAKFKMRSSTDRSCLVIFVPVSHAKFRLGIGSFIPAAELVQGNGNAQK
jgi:hypothetical protein